jgi:hypothetical protein
MAVNVPQDLIRRQIKMIGLKRKAAGVTLAMAVAGLVGLSTHAGADDSASATAQADGKVDMMHCFGINVCKGHNACKTADNACAGHGSCKGHGFVEAPVKACADMGGVKNDDAAWQADTADFVHCGDVNVCKGHNDCKTASNACAGHGSCKGQGFVAIPAKSCTDIGGKIQS